MNFFKQSTDQARDAFLAMPMQSRVIMVMLAATIVIALGFLIRSEGSQGYVPLFGGQSLADHELVAIENSLSRAGLNQWKREGTRIMVPTDSKSDYHAALDESSTLPASTRSRIQDAIEKTSVFDSTDLRESRESAAKEQELAETIMAFPEVYMAKVQHDRGERIGLGRMTPQSCSVFVQPAGSAPLSRSRIFAIEALIQASYAGMQKGDVMVVDANSTSASAVADDEDPMLRKQREAEALIEQKVRKHLIAYPATIAVTAKIDPTMEVEKTKLKIDDQPTNLYSKSNKTKSVTSAAPDQGVPGVATNVTTNRAARIDPVETSNVSEDQRESRGVAGQEFEMSRLASLQVEEARVSIGLPASFYREQYIKDQLLDDPAKTAADVTIDKTEFQEFKDKLDKRIKAGVAPLLLEVTPGDDPFLNVTVWEQVDPPAVGEPPSQTAKMALTWLAESWQTLALVCLGLFALLVARSAVKSTGGSTPPEFNEGFGLTLPQPPAEEDENAGEDTETMTITGGSLKDELLTLVESNPEVAANVIRGWVGEAA